ncbi:MAG TPA: LCP family protein, partial [Acidimicrobiales bacterium]|nr:LCP family protein [Acidimicrobiales bacterium]
GRAKPPRSRRRRRVTRALIAVGVVVVLLVGAAGGYAWYLNHEVHRIAVKGLSDAPTKGVDAGTENILMVGSTSRCALKVQNPAYGLCTQGVTGINSDVVMVLHLNPTNHTVSILSIPRDLFVPNARSPTTTLNPTGANKIDAALLNGPGQLVAAIEEDFGIPIQHYVELNFDTFANVVTALGGITMYFPEPVFDAFSGLNVQTTGCRHLNGVEALQVVRARHLQYKSPTVTATTPHTWPQENQSDLARIVRDHEFLRVLATAVAKRGLSSPTTDLSLVNAVAPQLTVDSGFSASDMVTLVLTYHGVDVNRSPQLTVPVLVANFGSYTFKGGTYGDVEFPTEPLDQTTVDQFLGVTADTNTMAGGALPGPSSVTVSVLNGTGAATQAATTAQALGTLGFKIVGAGDVTPVGQEAETVVTYNEKTATATAAAELVARSLSGAVIMANGPTTDGAQVTVTTGTDFSVNASAPAPTTTTTAAKPNAKAKGKAGSTATTTTTAAPSTTTSTTTASGTTGASSAFAAPSSPNEGLSAWDPRACTAKGGEGS